MATGPRVPNPNHDPFTKASSWATRATGSRWAFLIAVGIVVVWAVAGPFAGYSENWQLVINTGTTIVTFLMVFLIQGAQNRESKAIHLKLDELIHSLRHARNGLINVESLSEEQLDKLGERYRKLSKNPQQDLLGDIGASDPPAGAPPSRAAGSDPHITVK